MLSMKVEKKTLNFSTIQISNMQKTKSSRLCGNGMKGAGTYNPNNAKTVVKSRLKLGAQPNHERTYQTANTAVHRECNSISIVEQPEKITIKKMHLGLFSCCWLLINFPRRLTAAAAALFVHSSCAALAQRSSSLSCKYSMRLFKQARVAPIVRESFCSPVVKSSQHTQGR